MAYIVDEKLPENVFVQLLAKKASIIIKNLWNRQSKLMLVTSIGPNMVTFKLYDSSEEDSLKLDVTLSNLGDIDEQLHQLQLQVNFVLRQYCPHCQHQNAEDKHKYCFI